MKYNLSIPVCSALLLLSSCVILGLVFQFTLRPHDYGEGQSFQLANERCTTLGLTDARQVMGLDLTLRTEIVRSKKAYFKFFEALDVFCHSENMTDWKNGSYGLLSLEMNIFNFTDAKISTRECEKEATVTRVLGDLQECVVFRRFEFFTGALICVSLAVVTSSHWLFLNYKAMQKH